MTNNTPQLAQGDEYIVFYQGGPYDGQNDTRISTDGTWDTEVTVLAAVDGHETQQVYTVLKAVEVGETVQVTYTWDAPDSDALEDPNERGEL
jgi:hypothetical protein